MIDILQYMDNLAEELNISDKTYRSDFADFLQDNDWFGISPVWQEKKLYITESDIMILYSPAKRFLQNRTLSDNQKATLLLDMLAEKYPDSVEKIELFYKEIDIPEKIQYLMNDFLLKNLFKDICICSDHEIKTLMDTACYDLTKGVGNIFCFLLAWIKDNYKVRYKNDYVMGDRIDYSEKKQAYDTNEYLELLYYLFNEDYIEDNNMYAKASESKNYADTWLFLSLHFICALRRTDLVRIYHPTLSMEPKEVLERIKSETFNEEDARITLLSITWRLNSLPLKPSKTQHRNGIDYVKFCVPESVEPHFGKLFAICEAHHQLCNLSNDEPLIRCISDYDRITRYMGDDIGSLFLEANFRSRSANKAYLQSIEELADDILGVSEISNTKGYILAALARSHKGSYGDFAHTTSIYLKDANFNGLTPEYVAMELFERGVLSFIPSMLLKMVTNNEYSQLPIRQQTELIKVLDMTPNQIEMLMNANQQWQKESIHTVNEIISSIHEENRRESILAILHRIGNGMAVSKQNECLCLLTAMKKSCSFQKRGQCIGCPYEISTKSTVFLLVSEYNRLMDLIDSTTNSRFREKYFGLLEETIYPALREIFSCMEEQYGEKVLKEYEDIIRRYT